MSKTMPKSSATSLSVVIKPDLLRWACERARLDLAQLERRFPRLAEWEAGKLRPTAKQLERFAHATHTPFGYFFLSEPPIEQVPIPDFRTISDQSISHPSADLLDTIYLCQQRQEWYRGFIKSEGVPRPTIGFANASDDVVSTAARMRQALNFDITIRQNFTTWAEALRHFIGQVDDSGVLVMVNGVVGNNTHRKLRPAEFRGFALSDDTAPLIFINGADSKSAQMFTLAHELAHIWLGETALDDVDPSSMIHGTEATCNSIAAEFLVPLNLITQYYNEGESLRAALDRLARQFKVSTLVILRRLREMGSLTEPQFWEAYNAEIGRLAALPAGSGGNFYLTQGARIGKRFARAVIASTLEGETLYRDAFHLLGFSKIETFQQLSQSLGVA